MRQIGIKIGNYLIARVALLLCRYFLIIDIPNGKYILEAI